jgi:exonuclease VII large subunit
MPEHDAFCPSAGQPEDATNCQSCDWIHQIRLDERRALHDVLSKALSKKDEDLQARIKDLEKGHEKWLRQEAQRIEQLEEQLKERTLKTHRSNLEALMSLMDARGY